MTDHQRASVSLSPGGWLLLGPLLGAAVGAGLYLAREQLRPLLPPPWDGLLTDLALVGQGAFAEQEDRAAVGADDTAVLASVAKVH